MTQKNLWFLVFAVVAEDDASTTRRIAKALGCELKAADTEGREVAAKSDYEATTFGMLISVRWVHEWAQGNVYRISGGTIDRAWAEAGDILTLDDYVIRLLRSAGIKQVMNREEFLAYEASMDATATS